MSPAKFIRIATRIVVLCALACLFQGCMIVSRDPCYNRSIWNAKIPKDKDFRGAVFVLEDIPKAELALLFAEAYPESFVVAKPAIDRARFRTSKLQSDPSFFLSAETEGIFIHEKSNNINVPSYLIFHKGMMTASDELPESIEGAPMVRLKWDVAERQDSPNIVERSLGKGLMFLTILTMGSVWPPPVSTRAFPTKEVTIRTQKLHVMINDKDGKEITASPNADREFVSGFIWSFFFVPFPERDKAPYFEESGFKYSPGGWSDCLKQFFNDEATVEYLDSCTDAGLEARHEWFAERYEDHSYFVEQKRLRNPSALRGVFFFHSAKDSSLHHLIWNGSENEMNLLIYDEYHR